MSMWKKTWVLVASLMLVTPAVAQQSEDELAEKMRDAEQRLLDAESRRADEMREREARLAEREAERAERLREFERSRADMERIMRDDGIEIEIRLREAEASLAEAAQHVAELSRQQLPSVARIERIIRTGDRPVLGVTIGAGENSGPVAGVTVVAVSPGGAAAEAGLRAGDVITAVNGDSLTADNDQRANELLLDFMQGVEDGDELTIEYLRNGKALTVDLQPRAMRSGVFAFNFDGNDITMPGVPFPPGATTSNRFVWVSGGSGLGDMEIVPLTERLGSYFGTDEGLLIVRAPKNEALQLRDGDVIQSIDGRKPTSVNHAMRILGSYQSGETLNMDIMRDKQRQTIMIEVPDDRQSRLAVPAAPHVVVKPHVVAVPEAAVAPEAATAPNAAPKPVVAPAPAPPVDRT